MAGGDANQRGIDFQNKVAAWFAVYALAERGVSDGDIGRQYVPEAIWAETPADTDDLLILTSQSGRLFVNVKLSIQLNDKDGRYFSSVMDQFVRQYWACRHHKIEKGAERPLDHTSDRLVLAISAKKTGKFSNAVMPVLTRIEPPGR